MRLQPVCIFILWLAVSLGVAARCAAQIVTNDADVIAFGIPRSTLIISGKFLVTYSGGGGATSSVKLDKVFKAYPSFDSPERGFGPRDEVTVYWTTHKPYDHVSVQMGTNVFLFFLRQEEGRGPNEFRDVTGETYPFVQASQVNGRLLTSKLKEKQ